MEKSEPRPVSAVRLRVATLLLPPLGVWLLLRSPAGLARKLLGLFGIALWSLLYAALVIFLLLRLTPLKVEWRGGYLPALTWHPTAPDFEALEQHRARHALTNSPPAPTAPTSTWTGFRGDKRDGRYDQAPVSTNWPTAGLPALWRQPCGGGYASFCIAQGLAFTIEQRRDQEVVVAYHLENGQEVWTYGWEAHFSEDLGGDGPRATPAYVQGRVYALGAQGLLCCLESETGKMVWWHNLLTENHTDPPAYGVAASPLIVEDRLIVLTAAGRQRSVICYDRLDGKELWHGLDDVTGYASPMLVNLAGRPQLLVCAATRTVGMALEDGQVLWEYPWQVRNGQMPISQPVVLGTNRFLLSAGYFTGSAAVEILATGNNLSARTVWQNKSMKNKFTSSVLWQDHIYGLDEDILVCLDALTGERKWKDGRYGYGQLVLAGGSLIILSGEGELALVKASPDHWQELARFPAIRGKTWNHPALADGRILVRNAAEMACFDLRPQRANRPDEMAR